MIFEHACVEVAQCRSYGPHMQTQRRVVLRGQQEVAGGNAIAAIDERCRQPALPRQRKKSAAQRQRGGIATGNPRDGIAQVGLETLDGDIETGKEISRFGLVAKSREPMSDFDMDMRMACRQSRRLFEGDAGLKVQRSDQPMEIDVRHHAPSLR